MLTNTCNASEWFIDTCSAYIYDYVDDMLSITSANQWRYCGLCR